MNTDRPQGLKGLIYSRTMIIIVLLMVQILFIFYVPRLLEEYSFLLYSAITLFSAIIVVIIINQKTNPAFQLTWILLVLVFPVFGTLLYIYVKLDLSTHKMREDLSRLHYESLPYLTQDEEVLNDLFKAKPSDANFAYYLNHQVGYPVYNNTDVMYFPLGEEKFEELKRQLWNAENFIFLEYFIVSPGIMWETIHEILVEKAKEGLEVRVLFDGMSASINFPYDYPEQLKTQGIDAKIFSPVKPIVSTVQNNRDHRKIVVIDGEIAFTGGVNLSDEYINRKERFGHWKDAAIMVRGSAVQSFTMMFLEMWNVGESKKENYAKYLTPDFEVPGETNGFVLPYADNPFDNEDVGENVYIHIISHAKKYVHIMTPYLILDNEMISALTYAAKQGIDIKIIMPGIPDKWYAFALAKTYYTELIRCGVQIYEYTPGFVHSKVFVSDDECGTVGSVNCDYRSLFLHFECGAYIYRNTVIRDMENDFQETMEKCHHVTMIDLKKRPFTMKIAGWVLRLIAPLM